MHLSKCKAKKKKKKALKGTCVVFFCCIQYLREQDTEKEIQKSSTVLFSIKIT